MIYKTGDLLRTVLPQNFTAHIDQKSGLLELSYNDVSARDNISRILLLSRAIVDSALEYCSILKATDHLNKIYLRTVDQFTPDQEFSEISIVTQCHTDTTISGYRMVNNYMLLETLGQGNTGKVKHCVNIKNGKDFAIKIYYRRKLLRRQHLKQSGYYHLRREIDIMKHLNHPNIVRLYSVIDDSEVDYFYLVMEYVAGGTIMDAKLTGKISEDIAKSYFRGLISAIKYLHARNIVHRDIKPENILVSPSSKCAKICDFSSAELLVEGKHLTTSAGTPAFTPPELCQEYEAPPIGYPIDIWSLGVTLYCVVFGAYPFTGKTLADLYENIIKKTLRFRPDITVSKELKDLLYKMLKKILSKELPSHKSINMLG